MALIVEKYGGTSVANVERMHAVARRVAEGARAGDRMVVVVSAMGGETDRLAALAKATHARPAPRELDVLLSTGEQVTIALLALALHGEGVAARSYTGAQIGLRTDAAHGRARIESIDTEVLQKELARAVVPVVAGFQGVDADNNITTLGRGGTDTTAVAVACALRADECRIYTDVDGVYTADPRVVPDAKRLARITFEEMLELAGAGAKVLQTRAVEFAGKYRMPVRVLSSFERGEGTLIDVDCQTTDRTKTMEQPMIAGVTYDRDQAKITVRGVPDKPGIARRILGAVSAANMNVDMIVQNVGVDGLTDLTFTIPAEELAAAQKILAPVAAELGAELGAAAVAGDADLAKISVVGVGMRSHAGIAAKMFEALAEKGINIQMISTSEIKISVTVAAEYAELAVRTLHKAFNLAEDAAN